MSDQLTTTQIEIDEMATELTPAEMLEDDLYFAAGIASFEDKIQQATAGIDATQVHLICTAFSAAVSAALRTAYRAGFSAHRDGQPQMFAEEETA